MEVKDSLYIENFFLEEQRKRFGEVVSYCPFHFLNVPMLGVEQIAFCFCDNV